MTMTRSGAPERQHKSPKKAATQKKDAGEGRGSGRKAC